MFSSLPGQGGPIDMMFSDALGGRLEAMKTAEELRIETRRIRERARELSGFWTSELAAATYALEWVLEKRPAPPSADIGSTASEHGRIAESLLKTAQREPRQPTQKKGPRRIPSPPK